MFSFHRCTAPDPSKSIAFARVNRSIENLSSDGQMTMDYLIGLRTGDIGDYAQPSETLYLQVFNETGLQKLVSSQYITRSSNEVSLDKSQLSFFPFDYPTGGSFHVVNDRREAIRMHRWSRV